MKNGHAPSVFKKPIIPILLDPDTQPPFRLHQRQYVDFTEDFDQGIARLRTYFDYLESDEGKLQILKDRLKDAERDLRRARDDTEKNRIEAEIEQLQEDIERQETIAENPEAAATRTEERIARDLERIRQPTKLVRGTSRRKIIGNPPASVPTYWQDRYVETKQVGEFLMHPTQRLLTVVGRGGIGKTSMICRILKHLEANQLPDDNGKCDCNGIVYLSLQGQTTAISAKLLTDLTKLVTEEEAAELNTLYKNPHATTSEKIRALLNKLTAGRYVLLLDNF